MTKFETIELLPSMHMDDGIVITQETMRKALDMLASDVSLGAAWKAPASEANVPCTAVHQIAQECARAICNEHLLYEYRYVDGRGWDTVLLPLGEVAERLERTLNAINARQAGGTKPTS